MVHGHRCSASIEWVVQPGRLKVFKSSAGQAIYTALTDLNMTLLISCERDLASAESSSSRPFASRAELNTGGL